jgi:hypothetical protein
MSYRFFLWLMRILALVSFGALLTVMMFSSPYLNNQSFQELALFNVIIFEVSLFLGLWASLSLFLFWLRTLKIKDPRTKELNTSVGVSIRQGFLLALIFLILLIMQSFGILVWWDGLLAVGVILLIELYFLAR